MAPKMDPQMKAKMKLAFKEMSTINLEQIHQDFRPFLVVYKDGHVKRFFGIESVPAGYDPLTGVESKDVPISPETNLYVRIYKPSNLEPCDKKIPLLIYFHGGGFCIESVSSPAYHSHLNSIACIANSVIVSVNYRLAPESPLPVAYDDSWFAIEWIVNSDEIWLQKHADLSRVFFCGDSAGANIAHHMSIRLGKETARNEKLWSLQVHGVVLIHPFFWGEDRIGSEEEKIKNGAITGTSGKIWMFVNPNTIGLDDPMINPGMDPDLVNLGCKKVLVLVAEKDALRDRGFYYKECLVKCGWNGVVEVFETIDEDHVFYLMNPNSESAIELMNKVVEFINSSTNESES